MPEKIDFNILQKSAVEILSLYQAAVSRYGSELVFSVMRKGISTGYNEMNVAILVERMEYLADPAKDSPSQTAKLWFLDLMLGMWVTGDLSPLIAMNSFFNMACHPNPETDLSPEDASRLISELTPIANKEAGDVINEMVGSLAGDGRVDKKEAGRVKREAIEAINILFNIVGYADIIEKGER